jgi:hypothetical protein
MGLMTIFKKLKALCERILNRNQWPVASQTVERPASNTSLFERHPPSHHSFPKVRRVMDRAKQKCSRFREDGVGKLDPELEHPPPLAHAECP